MVCLTKPPGGGERTAAGKRLGCLLRQGEPFPASRRHAPYRARGFLASDLPGPPVLLSPGGTQPSRPPSLGVHVADPRHGALARDRLSLSGAGSSARSKVLGGMRQGLFDLH